MALQLFKINSVNIESPQSSITFSSIPQSYTDLIIKCSVRSNRSASEDGLGISLNSLSSGYLYKVMTGNGSSLSGLSTPYEQIWTTRVNASTNTSGVFTSVDVHLPNYTGSNAKVYHLDSASENNSSEAHITASVILQSSTSAVTSLIIQTINGSISPGSTFTLYGVL